MGNKSPSHRPGLNLLVLQLLGHQLESQVIVIVIDYFKVHSNVTYNLYTLLKFYEMKPSMCTQGDAYKIQDLFAELREISSSFSLCDL